MVVGTGDNCLAVAWDYNSYWWGFCYFTFYLYTILTCVSNSSIIGLLEYDK